MSPLKFIFALAIAVPLASVLTYLLIVTGVDWSFAVFYNNNEVFVYLAAPFVLLGMFVPVGIVSYYLYQWKTLNKELYLIQFKRSVYSFIFTYVLMTILKVFTNRVDMEPFEPIGNVNTSDQFRFGFMNSNSWWESFSEGWPSGHTMIAVGMAIAIHSLIKSKFWKTVNIIYPILVAWSVSTAFHWLSDVIAGAILGLIVGCFYSKRQFVKPLFI